MKKMRDDERAAFSTVTVHGGKDDGKKLIMVPRWLYYGMGALLTSNLIMDIVGKIING